jgi:hypothetical protein
VIGNHLLLGAGSACLLLGFWAFGRQRAQPWLAGLTLVIPVVALLAFEAAWPNARLRVLTTAFGQVVFLLALQASLRHPPRTEVEHIYRRSRIPTLVYAAVLVWSYVAIADLLPTSARVDPGYHRALFSVASLLFMLSLAVRGSCAMDAGVLLNNAGNIESPGHGCGFDTQINRVDVDPDDIALGVLGEHGGFTPTYLPGEDSVAIDHGSAAQCLFVDQRGWSRPGGARCDVGAVEADADDTLFVDGFEG